MRVRRRAGATAVRRHWSTDAELAAALARVVATCEHITAAGRDRFLADDLDGQVLRLAGERLIVTLQAVLDDLPESFAEEHADLPFDGVAGMRRRLACGYDYLDARIVWQTLDGRLPEFVREVLRRLE